MIKSNELRIGNIIWTPFCTVCEVSEISLRSITTTDHSCGEDEVYLGIPLTEERLSGFGFIDQTITIGRKTIEVTFDGNFWTLLYQPDIGLDFLYLDIDIEFVHLLQNAVFALTGEELILKK